jgi:hypothetical protein
MIDGIETGKIPHETVDHSFNRIIKSKEKLTDDNEMDLEQILEENKKLAEEMRSYLTE